MEKFAQIGGIGIAAQEREANHVEMLDEAVASLKAVRFRMQEFIKALNGMRGLPESCESKQITPAPVPGLIGCLDRTPREIQEYCEDIRRLINEAETQLRL